MKTVSRGLLALLAAVTIGAMPSAAHAERVVHQDARGDLTYSTYDAESGESGMEPAPTVDTGDVAGTVVRHGTNTVFVAIRFRDLRRADSNSGHFLRVVTNEGVKRNAMLDVSPERPQGMLGFYADNGARPDCAGVKRHIDYADSTITFELPRRCLGNPRWVRVGFTTYRYPSSTSYNGYIDDANQDQDVDGRFPTLGSRVSRN